jgi:hypothetical protein
MENNKNNKTEVEVIEPKEIKTTATQPQTVNLFKIGTLNIYQRGFKEPLKKRYENFYRDNRKHLLMDIFFLFVIIFLLTFNAYLLFGPSTNFSLQLGNLPIININKGKPENDLQLEIKQSLVNQANDVINLNKELTLKISLQNLSGQDLSNIKLSTEIGNQANYQIISGSLNKNFDQLTPNQTIDNYLKIKITEIYEPIINIQSKAIVGSQGREQTISSNVLTLKVSSDLSLASFARYYTAEGDQLGVGSLPPAVGESTKYWIFWEIKNSFNELTDLKVSATLPSNVTYTGKSSVNFGQAIQSDQTAKSLHWAVGQLTKGEKNLQAAIEVEIIPGADQLNTSPFLMNNITVSAKDLLTGEIINITNKPITTNLINDILAKDKGKVI